MSFEPPAQERPFQQVYDQMMTAPKYNKNVTQNHPWVPHPVTVNSVRNKSGGAYDIINN